VEDGVYAFYEPGNFQEVISYLVLGTQRALLIDTGMGMGRYSTVGKTAHAFACHGGEHPLSF
jgi:glyoxylase-like metal-dependent hydrolase (beta-lactamase superfamily II)